jgi:hypothetical protein
MSSQYIAPKEMEENLMGLAATLEPTKRDLEENPNKNFTFDPNTGAKTRVPKDNGNGGKSPSKADRRKQRSNAFWDKLS